MDRAQIIHDAFIRRLTAGDYPAPRAPSLDLADAGLTPADLHGLVRSQFLSRQLDRQARVLQAAGLGFYTIGSAGHEGNAAIAAATRADDMAFLHYRDAAFLIERARRHRGRMPVMDMLLSFVASAEDPVSGGRHKVLGAHDLLIPPQTSTIASHLPKAVGTAFSVGLSRQVPAVATVLPRDAIVIASFGDASANHSTAQGAFNTALWTRFRGASMPILFVCEDNGIGISVKTPPGWIEAGFSARPGLAYLDCDGLDLLDTHRAARAAVTIARSQRRPVFLHMRCVRLYGHAGSDVQTAYRTQAEIDREEAEDPLLHSARLAHDHLGLTGRQLIDEYLAIGAEVADQAPIAAGRPKLASRGQITESLIPPARTPAAAAAPAPEARQALFGSDWPQRAKPQPMGRLISWALTDLMAAHPEIILAGEDIGKKGGVYGATLKLQDRFGAARVIDTLLDEQAILGLAIGLAHNGFLPIPEIQFLAYLHNAEDQLRGEAATLSFFSHGRYTNPMVVRIAGLGYQKGFGGHFHNDNAIAVLRDIPGLVVACPSRGDDAVHMLRECVRLAREEQRVVVMLEPIALYPMRDLHADKDGGWARPYPDPGGGTPVRFGQVGVSGDGTDLAIVTYGNGVYLSEKARPTLRAAGIDARILDLRWLSPLPMGSLIGALAGCGRILIVDECRAAAGPAEGLITLLSEQAPDLPRPVRIAADDSFIPLGPAAVLPLPSVDDILEKAKQLCRTTA